MEITVLIMTPLALEYEAVMKQMPGEHETLFIEQSIFVQGSFQGKHHKYKVLVCETGMKNIDMALATERAIKSFNPQIVLLVGIAGGIKDVEKGDVAVASSAFNYDSGKETDNGFLPRPSEYKFSRELFARAQAVSRRKDWNKRCKDGAVDASVHFGHVAAGDKVVAALNTPTYDRIVQFLSHCIFLEMEAGGFGPAIQQYRNIHALVIRGISDMCAGKAETDKENWQHVAAERASAFAFEMLYMLDTTFFSKDSKLDNTTKNKKNLATEPDIKNPEPIQPKPGNAPKTNKISKYLLAIFIAGLAISGIYRLKQSDYFINPDPITIPNDSIGKNLPNKPDVTTGPSHIQNDEQNPVSSETKQQVIKIIPNPKEGNDGKQGGQPILDENKNIAPVVDTSQNSTKLNESKPNPPIVETPSQNTQISKKNKIIIYIDPNKKNNFDLSKDPKTGFFDFITDEGEDIRINSDRSMELINSDLYKIGNNIFDKNNNMIRRIKIKNESKKPKNDQTFNELFNKDYIKITHEIEDRANANFRIE